MYKYAHESMLHVFREKQIKTKVKVNHTPIGMAKINKKDNTKYRWDMMQLEILYTAGGDLKLAQPLWKQFGNFLKRYANHMNQPFHS